MLRQVIEAGVALELSTALASSSESSASITFGANSGGPINAALFAARLLAVSDPALAERVEAHRGAQAEAVRAKDARLQTKLSS